MASLARTSTCALASRPSAPERPARQQCSAHPAAAKLSAAASATFGGASKVPVRMVSGAVRRPAAATPFRAVRTAATVAADKAVALESEMDIDYTPLEEALKSGEFRKADDMTRALLITLAGDDAETREYVYFTEVKNIPVADLKTIDALWVAHSDGKFGYSVQRKLWKQKKEQWGKFFTLLDWTTGENNSYRSWAGNEYIYSMEAKKGHLPLTSCLRGTQLLRGLFEHPAIAPPAVKGADGKEGSTGGSGGGGSAGGKPDWLKF